MSLCRMSCWKLVNHLGRWGVTLPQMLRRCFPQHDISDVAGVLAHPPRIIRRGIYPEGNQRVSCSENKPFPLRGLTGVCKFLHRRLNLDAKE